MSNEKPNPLAAFEAAKSAAVDAIEAEIAEHGRQRVASVKQAREFCNKTYQNRVAPLREKLREIRGPRVKKVAT